VLAILLGAAVAVVVVMAAVYATAPRATRVRVGDRAPALSLRPLSGGAPMPIPGLGQAPVLLVLLDSGWPNATRQLADVERLQRRYLTRGLRVVGISLDLTAAPMLVEAERATVTFTLLHDPGGTALRGTYGVPRALEVYLIAPSGVVEAVYLDGFDWRQAEVRERLEAHLAPPPPGW